MKCIVFLLEGGLFGVRGVRYDKARLKRVYEGGWLANCQGFLSVRDNTVYEIVYSVFWCIETIKAFLYKIIRVDTC